LEVDVLGHLQLGLDPDVLYIGEIEDLMTEVIRLDRQVIGGDLARLVVRVLDK